MTGPGRKALHPGLVALILVVTGMLRLLILVGQPLSMGGDTDYYLRLTDEIVESGQMPPAALIKANGFPLYLASLKAVAGDRYLELLSALQIASELGIVLTLQALVFALLKRWPRAAYLGLTVVGLQPFTSLQTRVVLSEPAGMMFLFLGGVCLAGALARPRRLGWVAFFSAGLVLGTAAIMRAETIVYIPFMVAVFGLTYAWARRYSEAGHRILVRFVVVLAGVGVPITGLSLAQFHATGDPTLFRGESFYSHGYYDWLRTWFGWEKEHHNILAFHTWSERWRGWEMGSYPERAFASPAERREVERLLEKARLEGPAAADEEFASLAASRRRDRPAGTFVIYPVLRMSHYWLNLEGGPVYFKAVSLPPLIRKGIILSLLALRFVLASLVALSIVWAVRKARAAGFAEVLALLATVVVVSRTGFLGAAGTVVVGGLMESRYVTIAWPFYLLASAAGLRELLLYSEQRSDSLTPSIEST